MKKIFGLVVIMLVILTGCGADVTSNVFYNSEDGTYTLVTEVYVDEDDIDEIEGGIATIDSIIENTFSDSDNITSEEEKFGKTYFIEYKFDSQEDLNEFIEENSESANAGVISELGYDYSSDGLSYTLRLSSNFTDYLDYYASSAADYINDSDLASTTLDDYDVINSRDKVFYYDEEELENNEYTEEVELATSSYNLEFRFSSRGKLKETTLKSAIDLSKLSQYDDSEELVDEYFAERCYVESDSSTDDELVYSIEEKGSDLVSIPCFSQQLGQNEFEVVKCSTSETFLFDKVKCRVPDYDELRVSGKDTLKINAKVGDSTFELTAGEKYEKSSLKVASLLIIIFSFIVLIAMIIILRKILKKNKLTVDEIKKKSAEFSSVVKDQATTLGSKTSKVASELKDKTQAVVEKNAEEASEETDSNVEKTSLIAQFKMIVLDSVKNVNITLMIFIALVLGTSVYDLVGFDLVSDSIMGSIRLDSQIITEPQDYASFMDKLDLMINFDAARFFIIALLAIGIVLNIAAAKVAVINKHIKLISIIIYSIVIVYGLFVFILSIGELVAGVKLMLSFTFVLALITSVLGILACANKTFANKINKINLFSLALIIFITCPFTYTTIITVTSSMFKLFGMPDGMSISISFAFIIKAIMDEAEPLYSLAIIIPYVIGVISVIIYFIVGRKSKVYSSYILPTLVLMFNIFISILFIIASNSEELEITEDTRVTVSLGYLTLFVSAMMVYKIVFGIIESKLIKKDNIA